LVAELGPDVLVLDLVMPGLKPSDVEHWVRRNHPETSTLILTAHDRDAFLAEMEEAGAAGFLTKDGDSPVLVAAIRRAAQGEAPYTPPRSSWSAPVAGGRRWAGALSSARCPNQRKSRERRRAAARRPHIDGRGARSRGASYECVHRHCSGPAGSRW
jgi:DNA-binding NarL/FixJ family response regulator